MLTGSGRGYAPSFWAHFGSRCQPVLPLQDFRSWEPKPEKITVLWQSSILKIMPVKNELLEICTILGITEMY